MEVVELEVAGAKLIKPKVFKDQRGFFLESYQENAYRSIGITENFVQDNHSFSLKGTVRGMHFQSDPGQVKLVRVASGLIFDVIVDMRKDSVTFKQWLGVHLDGEHHHQLLIPVGCAHGFCVLSPEAHVMYKVSSSYDSKTEKGFCWNDPEIGIQWPMDLLLTMSDRDRSAPLFREVIS